MNAMQDGWFTETNCGNGNPVLSLDVDQVLHHERSKYQDILVFRSKSFGKVLVLDDAIQCTERDEFSYQEMISFLPLNSHTEPRDVLIIGGGDGGVAREVVKHPSVQRVTQCEIDEKVVEVSKKFLPFMAEGFDSPKVTLHIGDGLQFIKDTDQKFDVIITDSSDPIGPAVALFQKQYYEGLKRILKPGGIVCSQGESIWYDLSLIQEMVRMCRDIFPVVDYASIYTPTYPSGQIGFLLCSSTPDADFRNPVHRLSEEQLKSMKIRYYSPEMHQAAFVLPRFATQSLNEA
ncbi:spermidine synthase-like [Ornithodoros turicata]|uniref:spermidine synthase-like n=1 Tax=Ornithodoros turicata TaxID=34597 RepID=UPI00313876D8